jgi:hypothetical protein
MGGVVFNNPPLEVSCNAVLHYRGMVNGSILLEVLSSFYEGSPPDDSKKHGN